MAQVKAVAPIASSQNSTTLEWKECRPICLGPVPDRIAAHTRGSELAHLFPVIHKDALGPALTHKAHGHRQGL